MLFSDECVIVEARECRGSEKGRGDFIIYFVFTKIIKRKVTRMSLIGKLFVCNV